MKDYFRIYMQKEGDGAKVMDTITDFGMYVSEPVQTMRRSERTRKEELV